MKPRIYTPPTVDLKLLKAAGIAWTPMSLAAGEVFEPLDSEMVRERIAATRTAPENGRIPVDLAGEGEIVHRENFRLTIDRALLDRHISLRIHNCANFSIRTDLKQITPSHDRKFFIHISDCAHFTVEGINCSHGRNMVFVTNSSFFTVRDCCCSDAEGSGVIIHDSSGFMVSDCRFQNNLSACVLIIGHSHTGAVQNCVCDGSRGYFNHDAAIHLCQTSPAVTVEHIPERYHEPMPITGKTRRPRHILIENCSLANCRSQGIYLEGAVNCLIENNTLFNNNKEGICLDWGSCSNIFCRNSVSLNGERRNLSPAEIKADFIAEYPLLEDESSSMKLPGISLDNGSANLIADNKITGNYGGGIKMIRSSLFNAITGNRLVYNAVGANRFVPYFHGITILGIDAVNREFNADRQENLDFLPSILNSITGNEVRESLEAIFLDTTSTNNVVADNIATQHEPAHHVLKTLYLRAQAYALRWLEQEENRQKARNATRTLFRLSMQKYWSWRLLRCYPAITPDDGTLERWQRCEWPEYKKWIDKRAILTVYSWKLQHQLALKSGGRVRITIVTPVYNTAPRILRECIMSVRFQTSPFWELILADDGSTSSETLAVLRSEACNDPRIRVLYPGRNAAKGISAATNRAIRAAHGEYIVFLDHDDRLAPEALQQVIAVLEKKPATDIVYSDRDMLSPDDKRFMHLMKPDWSPENLYGGNYIFHLMCYRLKLIKKAGWLRPEYDGSQDYDLILRCMEFNPRIEHLPQVLYHWRQHAQSVAMESNAKNYAFDAGMAALADALKRRNIKATVTENSALWRGNYRIELPLPPPGDIGYVILPGQPAPDRYAETVSNHPVLREPPPYIFIQRQGYVAENDESARILASWLRLDKVGMASGRLLDDARKILYAGMIFGKKGNVTAPYAGCNRDEHGYMAVTMIARNISAPNPYSVMIKRELWLQLQGFDPGFKSAYALLDLALSALRSDWRMVYVPGAIFTCKGPRPADINSLPERADFHEKWRDRLRKGDPCYNPNLNPESPNYELT